MEILWNIFIWLMNDYNLICEICIVTHLFW
jgi:hypothetical protein